MNEFELDAIILDVLASYNGVGGTAYGDGFECMHATGTSHRHGSGGINATQTTHDSDGNPATPDPTAACPASTIFAGALPHNKCYSTEVVASPKMLPKSGEATSWGEA